VIVDSGVLQLVPEPMLWILGKNYDKLTHLQIYDGFFFFHYDMI
jgi:hypothetical protein